MIATTPVGSGTEMLKYGPATGLALPATCANLSAQPAYQTQLSIASSTWAAATARGDALGVDELVDELRAPALEQLRDAVEHLAAVVRGRARPAATAPRAATTASRASLREALAAFARNAPSAPSTS